MELPLWIILVLSFLNVNLYNCGQKYRARPNTRLKSGNVTIETTSRSMIACTAYCDSHAPCISISFSSGSGSCLLSSYESFDDYWNSNMPEVLESAVGWTTMSKIEYPVIYLIGTNPDRYMLTFIEAQTVCRDYGTEIASPQDLLEARAAGYELCSCGWLADETQGFVLQEANWICFSSFNTGILYCNQNEASVYCKSHR